MHFDRHFACQNAYNYIFSRKPEKVLGSPVNLCKVVLPLTQVFLSGLIYISWERSGSVIECLTRDRGATGSNLTGITALWSFSKTHLS